MKNLKNYPFVLLLFYMLGVTACSQQNTDSKDVAEERNDQNFDDSKMEADAEFAVSSADGGMLEVELAKLAQTKASSNRVKQLAEMIVTDHSKANEELKQLADQKNIALPTALSDESQKTYDDLAEKSGHEFDEAYTDLMVEDHKKDIDKFKDQAENGGDLELKNWASGKVATLEHHLEMAKQAEAEVDSLKNKST